MRPRDALDTDNGPEEALVGVVVPLYNGARFIRATLEAILSQTHRRLEVIVVDDGSEDEGISIVRTLLGDPRLALASRPNGGVARARNTGLSILSDQCEFMLFADHDDLIDRTLVERLIGVLRARPDASAAYAIADFVDEAGEPWNPGGFAAYMRRRTRLEGGRLVPAPPGSDANLGELFLSNPVYPPSGLLTRSEPVRRNGGFDPSFRVADDWDAVIRLARNGPLVPLDEVLVGYRRHNANASADRARNIRETRAIWAKTYYSPENTARQKRELRRWWRALQRRRFHEKRDEALRMLAQGNAPAAALRLADALAHLALLRPLTRWRPATASAAEDAADVRIERGV